MEDCIPIIEISEENFSSMWPALSKAISGASFIALDCELSGLGNRSKLNSSEIDMRYINTRGIAQEYSIVSLGISCFTCEFCSPLNLNSETDNHLVKSHSYLIQTFNILTLCNKYAVDGNSLKFLLSHGFDFNKLYSHGLQYSRGEDVQIDKANACSVKSIFQLLIKANKPLVFHNGFVDLVFLYQSFYADLPKNIETFAADLREMFPSGIYDTKYISEFHQSFPATYLEYIFKNLQMENENRIKKGTWHCRFKFPPYPKQIKGLNWYHYLQVFEKPLQDTGSPHQPLCESYKYHGWCSKADACSMSHDINRIVKELRKNTKVKRRKSTNGLSMYSVAQLINIKKQKVEEATHDVKKSSRDSSLEIKENIKSEVVNKVKKGETRKTCKATNVAAQQKNYCRKLQNNENVVELNCNLKHLENDIDGINPDVEDRKDSCNFSKLSLKVIENNNHSSDLNSKNSLRISDADDTESHALSSSASITNGNNSSSGHSAGYDAFMTGFIFACDISSLGFLPNISAFNSPKEMDLHNMVDKIYLIGKSFPFLIRSSSYNKTSLTHDKIIKKLRNV